MGIFTRDIPPIRTALFVPANRPDRVDKALDSGADMVIIDLEDAVPQDQKQGARESARAELLEHKGERIAVRVNSLGSGFCNGDLEQVVVEGLSCIMLPKVEDPGHIREIARRLLRVEREKGIEAGSVLVMPLIESALGVEKVFNIVSQKTDPPRFLTAAFGAADYVLDLGIEMTPQGSELAYPRARIPIACRAAGLVPPLDSPFMLDIKDPDAVAADAERAKALGFQGKLCIHPVQVAPCNAVFSPTPEEIDHARRVIEAFEEAESRGVGVIQLEGRFIDPPVVDRARRTLTLARMIGADQDNRR